MTEAEREAIVALLPVDPDAPFLLLDEIEGLLARARAEGVNDGVRLAADLIRQHVFAPNARDVARFLDARADRLVRPVVHSDPT